MSKNTIIINLFAGPGAGKSTTAAGLFYAMKIIGIECELVTEFAKDLTWGEDFDDLEIGAYVLGEQMRRLKRLQGKVDYVITDSPLLLSGVYEDLRGLSQVYFDRYNNLNYVVQRDESLTYKTNGRNQTVTQARELDEKITDLLDRENRFYSTVERGPNGVRFILNDLHIIGPERGN